MGCMLGPPSIPQSRPQRAERETWEVWPVSRCSGAEGWWIAPRAERGPRAGAAALSMRAIGLLSPLAVLALLGCEAAAVPKGTAREPQAAEAFLDTLQQPTFAFFWETTNPENGLTPDRWPSRPFSSIAAVGFALSAYLVGVERGFVSRRRPGHARPRRSASFGGGWLEGRC